MNHLLNLVGNILVSVNVLCSERYAYVAVLYREDRKIRKMVLDSPSGV